MSIFMLKMRALGSFSDKIYASAHYYHPIGQAHHPTTDKWQFSWGNVLCTELNVGHMSVSKK